MSGVSSSTASPPAPVSSMQLAFRPRIALISTTRRFVADFFEGVITDQDAISRVALTTHELLENALKYSTDGLTSLHIWLGPLQEETIVEISSVNRTSSDRMIDLRCRLDELREAKDPLEHYYEIIA